MLKSIDLFSGVGGFAVALKGIFRPVMYCDVDPVARGCMAHNILHKLIPKAPIHHDITELKSVPRADIVIGGFPCVGFSARGKREGFKHDGSGLFFEMMRILDESGAEAAFLENVAGVMGEIKSIIHELSIKRGFELRWEFINSHDVGAPHKRIRWYCLAIKAGSKLEKLSTNCLVGGYISYDWSGGGPPRTCPRSTSAEGRRRSMSRWGLMGNSIVPDAARLAFLRLVSGGAVYSLNARRMVSYKRAEEMDISTTDAKYKGIYVVSPGQESISKKAPISAIVVNNMDLGIVLVPSLRPLPTKTSPTQLHPNITTPVKFRTWATPAHSQVYAQLVMTKRSVHTLATQVRFEKRTKNREGVLAPRFVEWMMGYPLGFTDYGGDKC